MTYQSFPNKWRWWGRFPFGPAYRLVRKDAPLSTKLTNLRGIYWIAGGRSHWLTIGRLS